MGELVRQAILILGGLAAFCALVVALAFLSSYLDRRRWEKDSPSTNQLMRRLLNREGA